MPMLVIGWPRIIVLNCAGHAPNHVPGLIAKNSGLTRTLKRIPFHVSGQGHPASILITQLRHLRISPILNVKMGRDGGALYSIEKPG